MKVELERSSGRIAGINLIAESDQDKALLELLWRKDIKRMYLIYQEGEVRLETKVSEFDRNSMLEGRRYLCKAKKKEMTKYEATP